MFSLTAEEVTAFRKEMNNIDYSSPISMELNTSVIYKEHYRAGGVTSSMLNPIPFSTHSAATNFSEPMDREIRTIVATGLPKALNMSVHDILFKLDNNEYVSMVKANRYRMALLNAPKEPPPEPK